MRTFYLPGNSVKEDSIEKIYKENSYYHISAEQFFFYAYLFSKQNNSDKACKYYSEGIKSLLCIGTHKDYALSDLISLSLDYHNYKKRLVKDYFYKLEKLSYLMQYHTDRSDVGDYPDNWFLVFNQLYPEDSIKYLIYQTIHSDMVYGYFEYAFKILLESECLTTKPTLWFLLWLSIPILESKRIITLGFQLRDKIDLQLQPFFSEWVKNRIAVYQNLNDNSFPQETTNKHNVELKKETLVSSSKYHRNNINIEPFLGSGFDEALSYLNTIVYDKKMDLINLQKYILTLSDFEQQKKLIIEIAKKLAYHYLDDIEILFDNLSNEYLYFNIALFFYTNKGNLEVLTNFNFLQNAYAIDQLKTLEYLQEILSIYITKIHFI